MLLLFGLALAARAALAVWSGIGGPPVEDERGYVLVAGSLAEGRGFELPVPGDAAPPRTSFRAPLVPLLFAPVAALGGGAAAMRIASIVLGAAGAPLLYLAARRTALGERAVWAAAAYALWPPALHGSVRALSEPASQALLLGGIAALVAGGPRSGWAAGALASLAVLARPAALVPAALLVFAAGPRRRVLAFAAAFLVVLAPWVARNWALHGRPLLTTNSGVTLLGGNCDAAWEADPPGKWVPPERAWRGPDPPDLGMWGWSGLTEEASDRRFAAAALDFVEADPGRAAGLAASKLLRVVDPDPHSGKPDARSKALVGWFTLAPVLLLAAIGAASPRPGAVWWLLLAGTAATAVLFYGDTRMRTAADPALLVLAAHGVARVARRRAAGNVD